MTITDEREVKARELLQEALRRRKCLPCGCLHHALERLAAAESSPLASLLREARERLRTQEYACRGCPFCYPAEALNLIEPTPLSQPLPPSSASWPPLPGEYSVVDADAAVAVSTLGDPALAARLAQAKPRGLAIVGKTETENLGIERIVRNTIANPGLRYLILAGDDVPGHLPGESLRALSRNGIDAAGRIVEAPARHAVLANIAREEVEAFRRQVRLIDLIGCSDIAVLAGRIERLAAAPAACGCGCSCGDAPPPRHGPRPTPLAAPEEVRLDRAGYFVILPLFERRLLRIEHYDYRNRLLHLLEGEDVRRIYLTIIGNGWITELTHAAYLGKELARAWECLEQGRPYTQDGA